MTTLEAEVKVENPLVICSVCRSARVDDHEWVAKSSKPDSFYIRTLGKYSSMVEGYCPIHEPVDYSNQSSQ